MSTLLVSSFPLVASEENLMTRHHRRFLALLMIISISNAGMAMVIAVWQHAAAATAAPLAAYMSSGRIRAAVGAAATAIAWTVFYLSLVAAAMSFRGAYALAYLAYNPLPDDVSVEAGQVPSMSQGVFTWMTQLEPGIQPEASTARAAGGPNTSRPVSVTSDTPGGTAP